MVPLGEDFAEFGGSQAEEVGHEPVGFADELHVDVFDAVVDHLDVVAGAVGSEPGGAGDAADDGFAGGVIFEGLAGFGVDFGGDGFPDGLEMFPGIGIAAGHHGGAEACAGFTAGDAGAEEFALGGVFFFAADGVGPEGVAAVDDDVVCFDAGGDEFFDHGVDGGAGLDEDDEFAGFLDGGDEVLDGFAADEAAGGIFAGDEFLHHFGGAVVDGDLVAVVGDVEGEVFAHDGQADRVRCLRLLVVAMIDCSEFKRSKFSHR